MDFGTDGVKDINTDDGCDWDASRDCLLIGAVPHSWLFQQQQIAAVIHHGGAGEFEWPVMFYLFSHPI